MSEVDNEQTPHKSEMVQVDQRPVKNASSGVSGRSQQQRTRQPRNPYRAADFLSNVNNFKIIESTLRGTPILPYLALCNSATFIERRFIQRASSLPMPSSTPRPRLQLPKHSTPLVSSTSNSLHRQPLNNPDSTARPYASSASRPRSSHTSVAIWTMPELPWRPVSAAAPIPCLTSDRATHN